MPVLVYMHACGWLTLLTEQIREQFFAVESYLVINELLIRLISIGAECCVAPFSEALLLYSHVASHEIFMVMVPAVLS